MMLVGNKADMEDKRQVSVEDGQKLAEEYGMAYLETSASEERNIDQTFREMAKNILEQTSKNTKDTGEEGFNRLIQNS